jgi:hypothetical protein
LRFNLKEASFVDEVALKGIAGTVHVLAFVALFAGFGFAVCNDSIALTVGAEHRDE